MFGSWPCGCIAAVTETSHDPDVCDGRRRPPTEKERRRRKASKKVKKIRYKVFAKYGLTCGICGIWIEGPAHIDHVIPVCKGGLTIIQNLRPAHPLCNLRKRAQDVA